MGDARRGVPKRAAANPPISGWSEHDLGLPSGRTLGVRGFATDSKYMGQRDVLTTVVRLLDENKIPYLLTGSLAVSYYGYPRATHDIDFIIEVRGQTSKILKAISQLSKSYIVDKAQVKEAVAKFSQFDIYHTKTGIKIDFWIGEGSDFEEAKFKRKRQITIGKQRINLIAPEDLLLTKLLWCREVKSERHLRDCVGIWKIQKNQLDEKYLSLWAKKFKLEGLLKEISTLEY